jgi:hypothetical protein
MSPLSLISRRPRGHGQLVGASLFGPCCCGSGDSPARWRQQWRCLPARLCTAAAHPHACAQRPLLLVCTAGRSCACLCATATARACRWTAQLPVRHQHQHDRDPEPGLRRLLTKHFDWGSSSGTTRRRNRGSSTTTPTHCSTSATAMANPCAATVFSGPQRTRYSPTFLGGGDGGTPHRLVGPRGCVAVVAARAHACVARRLACAPTRPPRWPARSCPTAAAAATCPRGGGSGVIARGRGRFFSKQPS